MIVTIDCDHWEQAISARLDGELGAHEAVELEAHLARCSSCRAFEDRTTALHRVARVRAAEDVPDLSDVILANQARRRTTRIWLGVGAAAAVALLALTVGVLGSGGEAPAPVLAQIDGIATSAAAGSTSAVYLELVNDGGGDRLIGVSTADAGSVHMHSTEARDGLVVMLTEDDRPVAGHGTTILGPGGSHVMLGSLADDLDAGDTIELTLDFARSGLRTISVPVVAHSEIPDTWFPGTA